jgi:regulator of RNase E activity RraB
MSQKSNLEKLRDQLPWKRKGYKVLGKYNTANLQSADRQVLTQMLARHADLTRERHVVHYMYFPDDSARNCAELILQQEGYEIRHGVDYGQELSKSLIVERNGLVNEVIVDKERKTLTTIAEKHHGKYDGWEAALD